MTGPFRLDPATHDWDILDDAGELVASCYIEAQALHVLACLNERHLRDTAARFAEAARTAPGGGILPDKWRAY